MKKFTPLALAAIAFATPALAQTVPTGYDALAGGSSFLSPLATSPRTYQMLVHESQLTAYVGQELSAIAFRSLPAHTTAWPSADLTILNYDIYLSGSVDPAFRSFTFADNVVGPQTQVRSGPLDIAANSYPIGSNPTPFGPPIEFTTPYLYTGGNLLVEIRQSGFSGVSRSNDAVAASGGPGNGYGVNFSATWASGNDATSGGLQGNFAIFQFSAGPGGCRADLSGSTDPNDPNYGVPDGLVDASDFFYFLDQFAGGNLAVADLSGSTDPNDPGYGVPDGSLDASDFFYFLDIFVIGCP